MKKNILFFIAFICHFSLLKAEDCTINSPSTVCALNTISITFDSDVDHNDVVIDAFIVINGSNVAALIENQTSNSADIIFLGGGDGEIIIRYMENGSANAICNKNIFVLGGPAFSSLGIFEDIIGDQTACGEIDLDINTFVGCTDCPSYFTLDGESADLNATYSIDNFVQTIDANLQINELGQYNLCHVILSPDSSCTTESCIVIDIVELDDIPNFQIEEEESAIFCLGTNLDFVNLTTPSSPQVSYTWTVTLGGLQWKYYSENLEFEFGLPGTYEISLQYYLTNMSTCVSQEYSTNVFIEDTPIAAISCSSNQCNEEAYTFQVNHDCENISWEIDESIGEMTISETGELSVVWQSVNEYTETYVTAYFEDCQYDICHQASQLVTLFPSDIEITGIENLCDRGVHWYETALIPDAVYTWSIEVVDSIRGSIPEIVFTQNSRAQVSYKSFIGQIAIHVSAEWQDRACSASASLTTSSYLLRIDDNYCQDDVLSATIFPQIENEIIWSVVNEDLGFSDTKTLSGEETYFLFNFPDQGVYYINYEIPDLDFTCSEPVPFSVLGEPIISLNGPNQICPGDSATYTLDFLGGNDLVEWSVFISGQETTYNSQEITLFFPEDGHSYLIKVRRITQIAPGYSCSSDWKTFAIEEINANDAFIGGPEEICYDGIGIYEAQGGNFTNFGWKISPENMGTIIDGDSSSMVTIQWHYSEEIKEADLSLEFTICDSTYEITKTVAFVNIPPTIIFPDSVCINSNNSIKIENLTSFRLLDYFINGIQQDDEDQLIFPVNFPDTGFTEMRVRITRPNECPGITDTTAYAYVKPNPEINLITSSSISQCPKEEYMDVVVEASIQNSETFYKWTLSGNKLKSGFGSEEMYSTIVTKAMILGGEESLRLEITHPNGCKRTSTIGLEYECGISASCMCSIPTEGEITSMIAHGCDYVSVTATLNFESVINPAWIYVFNGSPFVSPILTEDDLSLDSIFADASIKSFSIAIGGICYDIDTIDGILDTILCPVTVDEGRIVLFDPILEEQFTCNDDLSYNLTLTEIRIANGSNVPSNLFWEINNVEYEGDYVYLENLEPGTTIDVWLNQCNLKGSYCCAKEFEVTVPEKYDPNIILPNGFCENDLWLFGLDDHFEETIDIIWDFGDESGSTLVETEKGFLDTLPHTISVIAYSDLGCVHEDEIVVQSAENLLDGMLIFDGNACQDSALLIYQENSNSTIVSYDWNVLANNNSDSIFINKSGQYSITVTDENGCTSSETSNFLTVNASFEGGLEVQEEYCRTATVSITTNPNYQYTWYVNGEEFNQGSFVYISEEGEYDIKVISTEISSGIVCDSLSTEITVFPLTEAPVITVERLNCKPVLYELEVQQYPTASWRKGNIFIEEGKSIQVAEAGAYNAHVLDSNGCLIVGGVGVSDPSIDLTNINDICISACREDLDSLAIQIDGLNGNFDEWSWVSVDSMGQVYIVATGSGNVQDLIISTDMYNHVQLEVGYDSCVYKSSLIPLDIDVCLEEEEEVEPVECVLLDPYTGSCGHIIHHCLLSEENGGPKYYYEGILTLPDSILLCSEDSLTVSSSNGSVLILDYKTNYTTNNLTISYSANILIDTMEVYEQGGVLLNFSFCNADTMISHCFDNNVPFQTCTTDFNCDVECLGVSPTTTDIIDVNYCLNLANVVQENCVLTYYNIEATLHGDLSSKKIYTTKIVGDFTAPVCIDVPMETVDFLSGEFQCIELNIAGECPGTECFEYTCGIFAQGLKSNEPENKTIQEFTTIKEEEASNFVIYPNPTSNYFYIEYPGAHHTDRIMIKNSLGELVHSQIFGYESSAKINIKEYEMGIYIVEIVKKNGVKISKKVFVL